MKPDNLKHYHLFRFEQFLDLVFGYKNLSSSAKICYFFLVRKSNEMGMCIITQKDMAEILNMTPRQVIRLFNELIQEGFIETVKSTGKDKLRHYPNTYYFLEHPVFEKYI